MDRRRYTLSVESLDGRVLLSIFKAPANIPAATIEQKTLRIERLPAYLESNQQGRTLPSDIVANIQDDIRSIVGKLHAPGSPALNAFNLQLRTVVSHASLSAEDSAALNARFAQALEAAGATPDAIDRLRTHMNSLANYDSFGDNPAQLAANDYSLILQTALAIGRPIRTPPQPKLSPADDNGAKGDNKTTVTSPHLVGNYDTSTTIQLLDENLNVIGSSPVATSGQYSVAPSSPLSPGRHTLRVRGLDPNGDLSLPSKALTIVIVTPRVRTAVAARGTPSGPLGF